MITRADFQQFVNARQAARSGDYDQALHISQELEKKLKGKLGEYYFS